MVDFDVLNPSRYARRRNRFTEGDARCDDP